MKTDKCTYIYINYMYIVGAYQTRMRASVKAKLNNWSNFVTTLFPRCLKKKIKTFGDF